MRELKPGQAVVTVCITCQAASGESAEERARAGAALAEATSRAADGASDVVVQRVRCLANCSRGPSAAIRCESSWTYVFGHLSPQTDGAALIAGARLLTQSTDGTMPWKGRPECLKRGLIARVPPQAFDGLEPDAH
jgi:predicted metal-binding protein